jgi:DNA modification methylase
VNGIGPYELDTIITGDCRELGKAIPDNSIDLIFTDPPYLKEYLYLYEWLAEFSARALKPEGFLMTYTGGYWKDEIMAYMRQHLEYFWDYTVISEGDAPMIWPRATVARAKSILCYRPKNGMGMPRTNVLGAMWNVAKQKAYHEWGQSEDEARYYIDCFTQPGDLVLEPFVGGGTTPAVCKVLGRPCVGFEVDPDTANVARSRVENTRQLVYQLALVPAPEHTQLALEEAA